MGYQLAKKCLPGNHPLYATTGYVDVDDILVTGSSVTSDKYKLDSVDFNSKYFDLADSYIAGNYPWMQRWKGGYKINGKEFGILRAFAPYGTGNTMKTYEIKTPGTYTVSYSQGTLTIGTFSKKLGSPLVIMEFCGAGGGGGLCSNDVGGSEEAAGGGGGGGGYHMAMLDLSANIPKHLIVGKGGPPLDAYDYDIGNTNSGEETCLYLKSGAYQDYYIGAGGGSQGKIFTGWGNYSQDLGGQGGNPFTSHIANLENCYSLITCYGGKGGSWHQNEGSIYYTTVNGAGVSSASKQIFPHKSLSVSGGSGGSTPNCDLTGGGASALGNGSSTSGLGGNGGGGSGRDVRSLYGIDAANTALFYGRDGYFKIHYVEG